MSWSGSEFTMFKRKLLAVGTVVLMLVILRQTIVVLEY